MGDASILRDQFDSTDRVIRKIFQKATYIADPDVTQSGQIGDHRAARLLYELAKKQSVRFGDGWLITGGTNQVTLSDGVAALKVKDDDGSLGMSYLFDLASNTDVDGWTTPSGANRTDFLYLDIQFAIIDAGDDATLVIPDIGQETAVDIRLQFTFVKQEGGSVPSPPSGHYYVTVATIARTDGVAVIADGDITNHLDHYNTIEIEEISGVIDTIYVQPVTTVTGSGDEPWQDDNGSSANAWIFTGSTGNYHRAWAFTKRRNVKYLKFRLQAQRRNYQTGNEFRFWIKNKSGGGYVSVPMSSGANCTWIWHEISADIHGLLDGTDCYIALQVIKHVSEELWLRKLEIWTQNFYTPDTD